MHHDFSRAIEILSDFVKSDYSDIDNDIDMMIKILEMFKTIYSADSQKPKNDQRLELLSSLVKTNQQYFNWMILMLTENYQATLKGFEQIDFMDKIASF